MPLIIEKIILNSRPRRASHSNNNICQSYVNKYDDSLWKFIKVKFTLQHDGQKCNFTVPAVDYGYLPHCSSSLLYNDVYLHVKPIIFSMGIVTVAFCGIYVGQSESGHD